MDEAAFWELVARKPKGTFVGVHCGIVIFSASAFTAECEMQVVEP